MTGTPTGNGRPAGVGAGIAAGTRVRDRYSRSKPHEGTVIAVGGGSQEGRVFVHRDDGARLWYLEANLEVVAPPVAVSTAPADLWDGPVTLSTEYVYATERVLAPGIVVSADTCDGKPRLAGTRTPTDTARSWPDYAAYHAAYPHITPGEYERAACFEAGVRWAKERRKAKKKAKGGKGGR